MSQESLIWDLFISCENEIKAECQCCHLQISWEEEYLLKSHTTSLNIFDPYKFPIGYCSPEVPSVMMSALNILWI